MSRVRRKIVPVVAAAVALVAALPACGSPERDAAKELQAAVAKTERMSGSFTYEDRTYDGVDTKVRGLTEDDFRYQAQVVKNGAPLFEEVVDDDALADRFVDPTAIDSLLRTGVAPKDPAVATATLDALKAGRWVVDAAGAPPVFNAGTKRRLVGDDPIFDARTVLQYIETIARVQPVVKFNADSLDYKPREDPFPKPAKTSGVQRYDFIRFPVPRPSDAGEGGNQAVPSEASFRKMSVYVKKGAIFQILEDIDITSRLDDIERNYKISLPGSTTEKITTAVKAINVVRKGQGQDPIRIRKMSMNFSQQGQPLRVEKPADPVTGDLSILTNRGKTAPEGPSGSGG